MVRQVLPGTTIASPRLVSGLFGEKLRIQRQLKGLTQAELGTLVGLTRVTIANIEYGRQNIQLYQCFAFAEALDVSVESLIPTHAELTARFVGFDRVRTDGLSLADVLFLDASKAMLRTLKEKESDVH